MSHSSIRPVAATLLVGVLSAVSSASPRLAPQQPDRGSPPHVVYSTLLGGAAGSYDGASDVAVDQDGNAIVVGTTESSDFPVRNALQATMKGSADAFVAKFAPDGTLLFSTFLGGTESDSASAVAVDASGAIYVAGSTNSTDFPVKNGFQMSKGDVADAFVAKLAPDGSSIVWASFLGGNGSDSVFDLAVDTTGRVVVAGEVVPLSGGSATFPVVGGLQSTYGGGSSDAFLSLVSADGRTLVASTLLDMGSQTQAIPPGRDVISTIRVIPGRSDVFFSGYTDSDETDDAIAFVARIAAPESKTLDPQLSITMIFHAYPERVREYLEHPELHGWKLTRGMLLRYPNDYSDHKSPDGGPAAEVTMLADGLCHPGANGTCDDVVSLVRYTTDLDPTEAANLPLLNEFYLDYPVADSQGAVYIAGDVYSERLTTVNPLQPTWGGNDDVVIAVLEPGTLKKAMVTFFGGDGYDDPTSMAVDKDGNIYVVGLTTLSTAFPTTPGALQTVPKGRNDGFLVKISPVGPFADAPDFSLSFANPTVNVSRGQKVTVTLDVNRVGGFDGKVKVSPPPQVPGFKSPKKSPSVPGTTLALKFKVKSDAPAGPTSFTFTGTDNDGRTRTATVTLNVE